MRVYLSRVDLERIAQDVVCEYMQLPKIKIQKDIERIDVFTLAENLMGLKVDFQTLSLDKLTFGLTSYFTTIVPIFSDKNEVVYYPLDGKTVLIEKDLAFEPMIGKFNFTIGHETSHHILRQLFPKEYGPQIQENNHVHYYRHGIRKPITDWDEWHATVLTAAILMPEELLKKNMLRTGIGEEMDVLNSRYRQEEFYKFCKLADMMGVSLTALRIRMKYLGLLKSDYYRNDSAMLEIVCEG